MEDTWICVSDDDSHHSASDSDVIDSETEADLYSTIHYEENLNFNDVKSINSFTSGQFVQGNNSSIATQNENTENMRNSLIDISRFVSNNANCLEENSSPTGKNTLLYNKLKQILNPTKKFKFVKNAEVIQECQSKNVCLLNSKDRDLNELSRYTSQKNAQNRRNKNNLHARQILQKDNASELDSSDSDIWIERDSLRKTNFKTNLLIDKELCTTASRRKSILKNVSMPNIKMDESCEGPWHINNEDLYRQKKYSHRYHSIDITCSNCSKKGHNFRICPVPKKIKCFICGGAHLGSQCMNRMCSICYNYGHDRKRCQIRPKNFYCTLCSMKGHIKENCPDLWRRYHLTTKPAKIIQGKRVKQDTNLYCWNCGDCGHFGGLCRFKYPNNLNTWPSVVSYDNPEKLLKKRLDAPKDATDSPRLVEHMNRRVYIPRENAQLKQNNGLNAADNVTGTRKRSIRRKKRNTVAMRFSKIKELLGEKDFPRAPKQNSPIKSEMPESVQLSIKQQIRRRKRNYMRKLKRQQKMSQANAQNLQVVI